MKLASQYKKLKKTAVQHLLLLISVVLSAYAQADSGKSHRCRSDEKQQQQAIKAVRKTSTYAKIERQVSVNQRVVFGPNELDKPVYWKNECHWSVSVYIDHKDRLELRNIFLVSKKMKTIYLQSADGDFVALNKSKGVN